MITALLIAASLAGQSSPDVLARSVDVCDASIESRAGDRYLRKNSDFISLMWSDYRAYRAESDAREGAFWADWKSRAVTARFTSDEMLLARRVCETKLISYLEGYRQSLSNIRVAGTTR